MSVKMQSHMHIAVPQQTLNRHRILPLGHRVRCQTVPERVHSEPLPGLQNSAYFPPVLAVPCEKITARADPPPKIPASPQPLLVPFSSASVVPHSALDT